MMYCIEHVLFCHKQNSELCYTVTQNFSRVIEILVRQMMYANVVLLRLVMHIIYVVIVMLDRITWPRCVLYTIRHVYCTY